MNGIVESQLYFGFSYRFVDVYVSRSWPLILFSCQEQGVHSFFALPVFEMSLNSMEVIWPSLGFRFQVPGFESWLYFPMSVTWYKMMIIMMIMTVMTALTIPGP